MNAYDALAYCRAYVSGSRRQVEDELADSRYDQAAAYIRLDQLMREAVGVIDRAMQTSKPA